MTWQWPEGAKEGDEVGRVELPHIVLGDHRAIVVETCALKYTPTYGDETDIDQVIRREVWCSCGSKVSTDMTDIKVAFMWHVMQTMSPKVTW